MMKDGTPRFVPSFFFFIYSAFDVLNYKKQCLNHTSFTNFVKYANNVIKIPAHIKRIIPLT